MEVFFGLAGEADDDVGRDCGVRDFLANSVEDPEVLLGTIRPFHRFEHGVRPRLQRHVKARHDRGGLGHRVDDVVGEGGGMGARETNAFEALNLAGGAKKFAERELVTEFDTIRVDVLSEECDLGYAVVDEGLDLAEDITGATVHFLPAQARNDAERAGVVAPDGNRDPTGIGRFAFGGKS